MFFFHFSEESTRRTLVFIFQVNPAIYIPIDISCKGRTAHARMIRPERVLPPSKVDFYSKAVFFMKRLRFNLKVDFFVTIFFILKGCLFLKSFFYSLSGSFPPFFIIFVSAPTSVHLFPMLSRQKSNIPSHVAQRLSKVGVGERGGDVGEGRGGGGVVPHGFAPPISGTHGSLWVQWPLPDHSPLPLPKKATFPK